MPVTCLRPSLEPPLPPHKASECPCCGVCTRCPSPQCEEASRHPAADRAAYLIAAKQRNEAAAAAAPARGGERGAALHASLAEEALAAPVTQAVEWEKTDGTSPLQRLDAYVDAGVSARALERSHKPFSAELLSDPQARTEMVVATTKVVRAVFDCLTDGPRST